MRGLQDWLEILPADVQEQFVLSGTEATRLRHDIEAALEHCKKLDAVAERAITLAASCNETTREVQEIARRAMARLEKINAANAAALGS